MLQEIPVERLFIETDGDSRSCMDDGRSGGRVEHAAVCAAGKYAIAGRSDGEE